MKKQTLFLSCLLALVLSTAALAADYTDVPADSWARESIDKAAEHGLMNGVGEGRFGLGETISREQFVTILVRMFGWESVSGEDAAIDIADSWAREFVNTAAANGVIDAGGKFRPRDAITRREMAVMLVRALGLGELAKADADAALPFTDVTAQRGYIAIAYEIGMTTGATETTFEPDGTATREQAAAMLVRVYEKYHAPTTWKHAFYALSSYSQLEQAKRFDAVSFGWSHMTYSAEEGAKLSTVKDDSSGFYIPAGYADVVPALREAGVELKLNVFMSGSSLRAMLNDGRAPMVAVAEILAELERVYPDLGYNPYSGVTIDFEGLRAADKESFNAFMTELSAALHAEGKTLYAAVMPAVYGDAYFDGYDFRTLSTLCDRVILMAHDYAASDLTGFLGSRYYRNHPCAPLYKVYYAVRTAAREMDDPAKLTLAVSMDARAWQTDADGLLTAGPLHAPAADHGLQAPAPERHRDGLVGHGPQPVVHLHHRERTAYLPLVRGRAQHRREALLRQARGCDLGFRLAARSHSRLRGRGPALRCDERSVSREKRKKEELLSQLFFLVFKAVRLRKCPEPSWRRQPSGSQRCWRQRPGCSQGRNARQPQRKRRRCSS